MFDIESTTKSLFKTNAISCREILYEYLCDFNIESGKLPPHDELLNFIGEITEGNEITESDEATESDEVTISISFGEDSVVLPKAASIEQYDEFKKSLDKDDRVDVHISIKKRVYDGRLRVYNYQAFSKFLCANSITQNFDIFTKLFEKNDGNHIEFRLLDTEATLQTNSILFSDRNMSLTDVSKSLRGQELRKCDEVSVFLDRNKIRLVPQDFEIVSADNDVFKSLEEVFKKLRYVLSYIYVANTSSISKDSAILQFSPSAKAQEFSLDKLTINTIIPQIYEWIFRDDGSIERAGIARKIISLYCDTPDDILSIDEKVLNSIKSDYVIYQKNHADKYLEMKDKISEFIVSGVEKIHGLSHDFSDSLRNNFIAVMVFLITVLLTDSVDFREFEKKSVSQNVISVCILFTAVSAIYLIITWVMGNFKWKCLKDSYADMKDNYRDLFDKKDLEEAFNNDQALKNDEKQYKKIRNIIGGFWIAFIAMMAVFTGTLIYQNYRFQNKTSIECVKPSTQGNEDAYTDSSDSTSDNTTASENSSTSITLITIGDK